jgi:hypothetical protein
MTRRSPRAANAIVTVVRDRGAPRLGTDDYRRNCCASELT